MATLILDTIQDAMFEQQGTIKRFVRTGIAHDLDTTNQFATLYNVLAIPGCPKWGDTDTVSRDTQLTKIQVRPLSGDTAQCLFIYESFQGAGPASAYIVTSRSYPRTVETTYILADGLPMTCRAATPPPPDEAQFFDENWYVQDLVPMRVFAPMRGLQVSQLIYGSPKTQLPFNGKASPISLGQSIDKGSKICHVNSDWWQGLDTGYWMLSEFFSSESKYQGYYQTEATAITKVLEDWGETGILRSSITGKYATVDKTKVAEVLRKKYRPGYIFPTDPKDESGFIRVGHYPLANFKSLFGFN